MIGVLVVDDHPAVRAGLVALLRREPGIVPVAAAQGMQEALVQAERNGPDVALVDYALGDGDGLMGKGAPAEELFEAIRLLASRRLRAPLATREALPADSARLDRADLPILGILIERVPHADIAEVLGLTATELDRRIRRFLARRATAARRTN